MIFEVCALMLCDRSSSRWSSDTVCVLTRLLVLAASIRRKGRLSLDSSSLEFVVTHASSILGI